PTASIHVPGVVSHDMPFHPNASSSCFSFSFDFNGQNRAIGGTPSRISGQIDLIYIISYRPHAQGAARVSDITGRQHHLTGAKARGRSLYDTDSD
ncbi:hypothetical protein, partial [Acidocella facilis]|uniref:hypothetical protein n=1 Tax=Acidocella facilis TaxID=525 RepID=UPI001F34F552